MPPTLSRKLVADTLPRKLRGGCLCGVACTSTGTSALLEAASAAGLQTANYSNAEVLPCAWEPLQVRHQPGHICGHTWISGCAGEEW